ncbi:hypothetical protein H6G89_07095 [Oscillatoria sp. FACHB-1407]|nr:hypothetical protein [Oscillatoria sp. FACHB-1407]MBD2460807.1 hypothetical protein [Oscillatoria sp. FACHB-1407]
MNCAYEAAIAKIAQVARQETYRHKLPTVPNQEGEIGEAVTYKPFVG